MSDGAQYRPPFFEVVSGVRVQVSGIYQRTFCDEPIGRELRTERLSRVKQGKQMTADRGQTVFCDPDSVI
jgi:hypothetical protein